MYVLSYVRMCYYWKAVEFNAMRILDVVGVFDWLWTPSTPGTIHHLDTHTHTHAHAHTHIHTHTYTHRWMHVWPKRVYSVELAVVMEESLFASHILRACKQVFMTINLWQVTPDLSLILPFLSFSLSLSSLTSSPPKHIRCITEHNKHFLKCFDLPWAGCLVRGPVIWVIGK